MATYCLSDIITAIGGIQITGTGDDDEVISIELEDDVHTMMKGGDGVGYARTPYISAKITIRLRQDATTNDMFSALFPNFGQGASGSVTQPWLTKDLNGVTLASGGVKLIKFSDLTFGRDLKSREYVFHCAKVAGLLGGNRE